MWTLPDVFIYHGNDVCPNCQEKDNSEINNLKNYLSENPIFSIEAISYETGISISNLSRHIQKDDFKSLRKEIKKL